MALPLIRRHSGAVRSTELWCAIAHLRIPRFRVWSFGPSRNDGNQSMKDREQIAEALAKSGYIADSELATAISLMQRLRRPLLLEGEAGVGKTEVAKALACVH